MLTLLDVATFSCYCISVANVIELIKQLQTEGLTYRHGDLVKRHPCVPMLAAAMRDVRLMGELFGLSPMARQRIDSPPAPDKDDPFDLFLSDVAGNG